MLNEIIAIGSFFAMLWVFYSKMKNISTKKTDFNLAMKTTAINFICWMLFWVCLLSLIGISTTTTDGTKTYITTDNNYLTLLGFAPFVNLLLFLNFIFFIIETCMAIPRLLFKYQSRQNNSRKG